MTGNAVLVRALFAVTAHPQPPAHAWNASKTQPIAESDWVSATPDPEGFVATKIDRIALFKNGYALVRRTAELKPGTSSAYLDTAPDAVFGTLSVTPSATEIRQVMLESLPRTYVAQSTPGNVVDLLRANLGAPVRVLSASASEGEIEGKEEGRTRSVYAPKDLVKEVQSWIRNHRRVKQLLSEISTLSIGIIQRHVAQKRTSGPDAGASRRGKPNNV